MYPLRSLHRISDIEQERDRNCHGIFKWVAVIAAVAQAALAGFGPQEIEVGSIFTMSPIEPNRDSNWIDV